MSLKNEIASILPGGDHLKAARAIFARWKEEGITQDEAMRELEALRAEVRHNEELEDKVLDIMDFTIGNCHPSLKFL